MTTIFKIGNFKYCIFANDHSPPHVHVIYKTRQYEARLSLDGEILTNVGFSKKDIKLMSEFIVKNKNRFIEVWDDYNR